MTGTPRPQRKLAVKKVNKLRKKGKVSSRSLAKVRKGSSVKQEYNNSSEDYWDEMAPKYNEEIFVSIVENDRKSGAISKRLDEFSRLYKKSVVADFGCGVGKYLTALTSRFDRVVAMDFSRGLLQEAQKLIEENKLEDAVSLFQADLTSLPTVHKIFKGGRSPKFGICMNVLLSPDVAIQRSILQTLHQSLAPKGHLLLLVPAFESSFLSNWVQLVGPLSHRKTKCDEYRKQQMHTKKEDLLRGVIELGGAKKESVRTQHYLRETIAYLCREAGFTVVSVEKVEYTWDNALETGGQMPKTMKNIESGPWDWLCVLKK